MLNVEFSAVVITRAGRPRRDWEGEREGGGGAMRRAMRRVASGRARVYNAFGTAQVADALRDAVA